MIEVFKTFSFIFLWGCLLISYLIFLKYTAWNNISKYITTYRFVFPCHKKFIFQFETSHDTHGKALFHLWNSNMGPLHCGKRSPNCGCLLKIDRSFWIYQGFLTFCLRIIRWSGRRGHHGFSVAYTPLCFYYKNKIHHPHKNTLVVHHNHCCNNSQNHKEPQHSLGQALCVFWWLSQACVSN